MSAAVAVAAPATDPFADASETVASPTSSTLERMQSHPSLTHSATSASASASSDPTEGDIVRGTPTSEFETLITPIEQPILNVSIAHGQEQPEVLSPIVEAPELPKKARLLSKSMQNLRKKKGEKGRERSNSFSEKAPPLPAAPPPKAPASTNTAAPPRATRPPLTSNKSGSFSSFLRKLTGKSASSPTSDTANGKPSSNDKSAKRKTMVVPPPSVEKSEKPRLAKLNTSSKTVLAPAPPAASPAPASILKTDSQAITPAAASAQAPPPAPVQEEQPKETDPTMIALPLSPDLTSPVTLPPGAAPPIDFSAVPRSPVKPASQPASLSRKSVPPQQEMHSFEGFDIEPEQAPGPQVETKGASPTSSPNQLKTSRSGEVEDTEEADVVRPLAPLRIPSRTSPTLSSATSPRSATLSSSVESQITTPTSAVEPGSAGRGAASGVGLGLAELGRKESKWRKSVMNLSGSMNGSANRRHTQKPVPAPTAPITLSKPISPPKESAAARQQRLAQNRVSSAAALQSTAELAAAARGRMARMNSEEEEMAETFFMA